MTAGPVIGLLLEPPVDGGWRRTPVAAVPDGIEAVHSWDAIDLSTRTTPVVLLEVDPWSNTPEGHLALARIHLGVHRNGVTVSFDRRAGTYGVQRDGEKRVDGLSAEAALALLGGAR